MKNKTIALLVIITASLIGASTLVLAEKPGTQAPELTAKAIPVFMFEEFQPGETRTMIIDIEGYKDIKIACSYPAQFWARYDWGCLDSSSGETAKLIIFEHTPSSFLNHVHPYAIAGSKLVVTITNQASSVGTVNIWLYVTP